MVLTVTILIQMHGKVFTTALNSRTANIFNNVRLLCKAEGFKDFGHPAWNEFILHGSMVEKFRHNLDLSTYDKLKSSTSGDFLGNVTYDKTLSRTIGNLGFVESLDPRIIATTPFQGIYLISVHDGRRLIYPTENKGLINLLNVNDINKVSEQFQRQVPNIADLSTPFPDQLMYLAEEHEVLQSNAYDKELRIKQIKQQYLNALNAWNLTMESDFRIDVIKLSFLVELVKTIIADDCIINLIDYSCNSPIINILDKDGYQYYNDNVINKKTDSEDDEIDFMERGIQLNARLGGRTRVRNRRTRVRNGRIRLRNRRTRVRNRRTRVRNGRIRVRNGRIRLRNRRTRVRNR
jgi:hypothetical protein